MNLQKVLAAAGLALGVAGAALAAGEGHHGGHGDRTMVKHRIMHGAGVEHAAMHNIMAELLSAKTGKSAGEIQKLFEESHPHEVMDELGLSEADGRALFKQAREKLVAKAQAAGLITAAQAEKIRAEPERRMKRPPPAPPMPPDLDE